MYCKCKPKDIPSPLPLSLAEAAFTEEEEKWVKAVRQDPELMQLMDDWFPKWDALIVPGSKKKGEVWTELEKLKVELSRQP
jgi:hypothetical protein